MKTAKIEISKNFTVGKTDDRLFGSFVEHMGATVYNGIYEPGHKSSDENGFRNDVLDLIKELKLTQIRYPGGNFVSGFNWEDSVGPLEERPVRLDLAWKAIEPNTFGLNEFMHWIRKIPSKPMMTVNLGTRGVDAARNLLEYCNYKGGTYYSDLRIKHGVNEPHDIKIWCLGNEVDGAWQIGAKTADEYGRLAFETGKVMKWLDPGIELIVAGSSTNRMKEFPRWDKTVLMHTYEIADFISLHHYVDKKSSFSEIDNSSLINNDKPVYLNTPEYLARTLYVERQIYDIIATCDYVKSVKRSNKTMYLAFDEWNVIADKKHEGFDYKPWEIGSPIDCGAHSMEDALAFASMMMAIMRRADRIKIACQSLLVNTGPLIVARKNGTAWRNTIFYPFMHLSLFGRGNVLQSITKTPAYGTYEFISVPIVDDLVVYNEENNELNVFVVNRSDEPVALTTDLRDFACHGLKEHIVMEHENLNASNTENKPFEVIPSTAADSTKINGGYAESLIKPFSWNVIRFSVK